MAAVNGRRSSGPEIDLGEIVNKGLDKLEKKNIEML